MPIEAERNVQLALINLMANCIDNFTHGLAIGSAFMLGSKDGIITTLCIMIHEVIVLKYLLILKLFFFRFLTNLEIGLYY